MFDSVLEKLEFEYSKWSNIIYAGSVSEAMTRAFEIAYKRALYQRLKDECMNFNDNELRMLMNRKNVIDYIYLKLKDKKNIRLDNEKILDEDFRLIREILVK